MKPFAELFIENLKGKELSHMVRDLEEVTIVSFPYKGRETRVVFNGEKGEYAELSTVVEHVGEEKFADIVLLCNKLNSTYRFLKFYVDEDYDLMARDDAILDESNAAEECFELLVRTIHILDDAKPEIMHGIY